MQRRLSSAIILSLMTHLSLATPAPSVFNTTAPTITTSQAQPNANIPVTKMPTVPLVIPQPPILDAHGYYLQDVKSGQVLGAMNADQKMAPASLTKLMTLYLTFAALQANHIHLNDAVPISQAAWQTGGSRMFVKVNSNVPVNQLIQGIIVDSGNDACVALAQFVGGTQQNFVTLMNEQAQLLGMKNTHYVDCTGLPDPNHYTTPHDIAILTRAIINNFPAEYHFFAEKTLDYNNITQPNRNRLLWLDSSVDGLKTGHTEEAGYCLVASAQQHNMRLISVLLGAPTDQDRVQFSQALLNYGFRFFKGHTVYKAHVPIEQLPIYFGKKSMVPIGINQDFYVTVPSGRYAQLTTAIKVPTPLEAPLKMGQTIGTITAILNHKVLATAPIIALTPIARANFFGSMWDHLRLWWAKH